MQSIPRKSSFPPVAAPDARLLILGSLPGDRSLAEHRYYAHPRNQFWQLITAVIDQDLTPLPYPDRLTALKLARIALWDVIASAHRPGSTDAALREPTANDLPALIATLPHLTTIAFNGATAAKHGRKLLAATPHHLIDLPSSSPLHTIGLAAKLPAWLALRTHLPN